MKITKSILDLYGYGAPLLFVCQLLEKQPQDLTHSEVKLLLSVKKESLLQLLRQAYQSALQSGSSTLLATCLKLYLEQIKNESELLQERLEKKDPVSAFSIKQIQEMPFEEIQKHVDNLLNEA